MPAKVVKIEELRRSERVAEFEGRKHGAGASFYYGTYAKGTGPGPHTHPYDETFVVLEGEIDFVVDGETISVGPGTVVVVPAEAVHAFTATGNGVTRQVNIHASPEIVNRWLGETPTNPGD